MSLLRGNWLGRVVLGCLEPLDYTDSFPYQLCDLMVYNGESPMWCLVWIDPLWDGLDAAFGQLSPLSSVLLLLHCLSSLCSSFLYSILLSGFWLSFYFSCAWLKAICTHVYLIPLPLLIESLATNSLGVPYSASSSGSQGVATCPPIATPIHFVSLVFPLHHGMSLFHHDGQSILQIISCHSLITHQFHLLHQVRSQPLDLEPPNPTPYTCFMRLTCSTVSVGSATVFSLLRLPCIHC